MSETFEPRVAYRGPDSGYDNHGEDGDQPQDFGAGWDLSFGCRVTFGYIDGRLCATVTDWYGEAGAALAVVRGAKP